MMLLAGSTFLLFTVWLETVTAREHTPPTASIRQWFATCLNIRRPPPPGGDGMGAGNGSGGGGGMGGGLRGRLDNRTLADRMDCIRLRVGNGECINDMDNVTTIGQCVQEKLEVEFPMLLENRSVIDDWEAIQETFPNFNAFNGFDRRSSAILASPCLDDYKPCIRQSVQNAVHNLEPCVNDTLREFAACGREQGAQCKAMCNPTFPNATELFGDLSRYQLATCPQIQTNLMSPVCDDLVCCGQCVEAYEKVAQCVVSEMLGFPRFRAMGNRPCAECIDNSRLLQVDDKPAGRMLTDDPADSYIFEECAELTPGLFAPDGADDEALALHTNFFSCVSNAFFQEVEAAAPLPPPTASPTPQARTSMMTTPTQAPTSGGGNMPLGVAPLVGTIIILVALTFHF